jgi:hypothetical protein
VAEQITLPLVHCCGDKVAPQIDPVREKVRWECPTCNRNGLVRLASVPPLVAYVRAHPQLAPIDPALVPQIVGLVRGKRVRQPSVDYDTRLPRHLRGAS